MTHEPPTPAPSPAAMELACITHTMSDTPRTDSVKFPILSDLQSGTRDVTDADFARALERELAAAQAKVAMLRADGKRLEKLEALCRDGKRIEFALGLLKHGIEIGISYPIEVHVKETLRAAIDVARAKSEDRA